MTPEQQDEHQTTSERECSDAVRAAIKPLYEGHDVRLILACLLAEAAYCAAMTRCTKINDTETLVAMFGEGLSTALTYEVKPRVSYTDGKDTGSKQ